MTNNTNAKVRNNSKEVVKAIREDILDAMELNDFLSQVGSLIENTPTIHNVYQAVDDMVQGGCFLVYYNQVEDYLKGLNIKYNDKDNQKMWDLYRHLLSREGEKIYNSNIDYYKLSEEALNIEVLRVNNSTNGNPRYQIVSWDNEEALDRLIEKGYIVELKSGLFTKCDAGYAYRITNSTGTNFTECKVLMNATEVYTIR